jgi:hypothetical protein
MPKDNYSFLIFLVGLLLAVFSVTAEGHLLSAGPLGHAGSMDLHSFCNGDPINSFDPTGRFG